MTVHDIAPGKSFRIDGGEYRDLKLHIRAIVDDSQIVFRYWNRYKQCWRYEVKSTFYFELLIQHDMIKEAK